MALNLSFDDKFLEQEYRATYSQNNRNVIKLGIILSYAGWIFMTLMVLLFTPENFFRASLLVTLILFPLFALTLYIVNKENLLKYYQGSASVANAMAALTWLYISYFLIEDLLILISFFTMIEVFCFLVLKIRFPIAVLTVSGYMIIYSILFLLFPFASKETTLFLFLGGWVNVFVLVFIGYFADQTERRLFISKKTTASQKKKLQEEYETINRQNKIINESIAYARNIQDSQLPSDQYVKEVLKDCFFFYKPLHIVSGDFYWVKETQKQRIWIAADCTGHGVPGAFMSMLATSLLNEVVKDDELNTASTLLDQLKLKLVTTLKDHSKNTEIKDGMDLALCIMDRSRKKLEYAGANNPLYRVRDGELIEYPADRMPIGEHHNPDQKFSKQEVEIQEGDMIYTFSDGYIDQFGGENGKKFLKKRFRKMLCEISNKATEEQHVILEKTIIDWMGKYEQIDDILVIGVRI
ncbi:MAG: SpoIIE family protein phosphatase [Bacteroidales bacterium]|nr:SpoIIE family protein phosphatase [Bacteroidales bacterium]